MAVSLVAVLVSASLEPALPALMKPLIDESFVLRDPRSAWLIPVLIVLVFLVKGLADYVSQVAGHTVAQKTIADLRQAVFSQQLEVPLERHAAEDSGRLLSRVLYDTSVLGEAISSIWMVLIRDTLVIIGLLFFLFYTSWTLALLVLVLAPALGFVVGRINKKVRSSSLRLQGVVGRLSTLVEEATHAIQEIKIFSAQPTETRRFENASQELRREQMRVVRAQASSVPLVQILAAISVAVVVFVATSLGQSNELTAGAFVSFVTAMSMIFEPVRRLANASAALQKGLAGAQSVFGWLDETSEFIERRSVDFRGDDSAVCPTTYRARGRVVFDDVSFGYHAGGALVFEHLSLVVEAGESISIVGQSGSGKSTLLHLMCGFYKPNAGRVLIDEFDVASTPLGVIRGQIGLVSQRINLFNLTVKENVLVGRPEASEAEVIRSLEAANALDFVLQLPHGLDTPMGAFGGNLSGGQRQRIAIARAFIKNAPILLLDEATSALDRDNEKTVLEALDRLMKGRTTFLVSHAPERLLRVNKTFNLTRLEEL